MLVRINGEEEFFDNEVTILDYIYSKGLDPEKLIVEYNKKIVKKDKWDEIVLSNKDSLEVLKFVGGG
ncbi:MAG: sulfur carrier protein ThiS [Halothermotrichaceae bacterium]